VVNQLFNTKVDDQCGKPAVQLKGCVVNQLFNTKVDAQCDKPAVQLRRDASRGSTDRPTSGDGSTSPSRLAGSLVPGHSLNKLPPQYW